MSDEGEPPGRFGPIASPVDRFAHLSEPTRRWLENMRQDDIDELMEAVRFARSAKTIGRFGRWLIVTVVATFTAAVVLGEKMGVAWKWIMGAPK